MICILLILHLSPQRPVEWIYEEEKPVLVCLSMIAAGMDMG